MHWVAQYIGKGYRLGSAGPDAFDCWGLVRVVQSKHYGRDLPVLDIGRQTNLTGILALARGAGWERTKEARDGDVLTMKGRDGTHIAQAVLVDGRVQVLHAVNDGIGVVLTQSIDELGALGFGRVEIWRFTE